MEKKQSARVPVASTDLKKQQDVSANKVWPKSGRKREPVGSSRSDNVNKKQTARSGGKLFDKRPKPRGHSHGAPHPGSSQTGLEECDPEVGSVFVPGSKKQNLNHLLNFNYASRAADGPKTPSGKRDRGLVSSNVHKHSKELFLQSNCQFVVNSDGDYAPHAVDPDIPVNWLKIEQINVRIVDRLNCPICLCEVIAGKITPCGHAFCWTCLLHYFALSESHTRPCPICFQPITKHNVKSVQGVRQEVYPVGKEICMRLMRRLRTGVLVEPAPHQMSPFGSKSKSLNGFLSYSDRSQAALFSKILIATDDEIKGIIRREKNELNEQLIALAGEPEVCFVSKALYLLELREDDFESDDDTGAEPSDTQCKENLTILEKSKIDHPKEDESGCENFEPMSISETPDSQTPAQSLLNPEAPVFNPVDEKSKDHEKYFYFYQAIDGQAIFLDSLDIRILEASWGGLSSAPREIRGVILQRVSGSVSVDSRRRLRSTQHLPIHCPYDIVEIELEPPYVSRETLKLFRGDLYERKKQREKRAKDEKRRERMIVRKDNQIMGYIPTMNININSEKHFPAYQPDFNNSLSSTSTGGDLEDMASSFDAHWTTPSTMSFAKMASTSGNWNVRPSCSSSTTANRETASARNRYDSDCSDDAAAAPPSYNVSLSEAITAAMNAQVNVDVEDSKKKKKKKQKAKVLFSTGIQHRTATD